MNVFKFSRQRRQQAFTLIELIIVIAVIGILAGLILSGLAGVNRNKQIALAKTEMQAIITSIDGYKTKLGFYPPDNTNDVTLNPLYLELAGTTNNGAGKPNPTVWVTMDGSAGIEVGKLTMFNITGLANSSTRAHSDDTGAAASTFINNLLPKQFATVASNSTISEPINILVCSIPWPSDRSPVITASPTSNPWRYNSSHPTNNVGSYDLWVDLVINGKTNRVCNWSTQPVKL